MNAEHHTIRVEDLQLGDELEILAIKLVTGADPRLCEDSRVEDVTKTEQW